MWGQRVSRGCHAGGFWGVDANDRHAAGPPHQGPTYHVPLDPGAGSSWASLCLCHCCRKLVLLSRLQPDLVAALKPDHVGSIVVP